MRRWEAALTLRGKPPSEVPARRTSMVYWPSASASPTLVHTATNESSPISLTGPAGRLAIALPERLTVLERLPQVMLTRPVNEPSEVGANVTVATAPSAPMAADLVMVAGLTEKPVPETASDTLAARLTPLTVNVAVRGNPGTVAPKSRFAPLTGRVSSGWVLAAGSQRSVFLSPQMCSASSGWSMKGLRLPWAA